MRDRVRQPGRHAWPGCRTGRTPARPESCQCRAAHVAIVPESQVSTASSDAARSSSTLAPAYCGAIGSRSGDSSAAIFVPPVAPSAAGTSQGDRADPRAGVSEAATPPASPATSPISGTSVGSRFPTRAGVKLDLHHVHLARLRQVLGVREVGAQHQQRVDVVDQLGRRRSTEQPDARRSRTASRPARPSSRTAS